MDVDGILPDALTASFEPPLSTFKWPHIAHPRAPDFSHSVTMYRVTHHPVPWVLLT